MLEICKCIGHLNPSYIWHLHERKDIKHYVRTKVKLRFLAPSAENRGSGEALIESVTPCHDNQAVGPYYSRVPNTRRGRLLIFKNFIHPPAIIKTPLFINFGIIQMFSFGKEVIAVHLVS